MKIRIKLPNVSRLRKSSKALDKFYLFISSYGFKKFLIFAITILIGVEVLIYVGRTIVNGFNSFTASVSSSNVTGDYATINNMSSVILTATVIIMFGTIVYNLIRTFSSSYDF